MKRLLPFLGCLALLLALFLCDDSVQADCGYSYGGYAYGGYRYYPAGAYGHRYYPAGYYLRTPTGWYRYGYGYEYGTPYCGYGYVAPPQLYTQVVVHKEPVLVPTYSVGYSPPPVDPSQLPQKNGMAMLAPQQQFQQPPPGVGAPGYQDLAAQLNKMRLEVASYRAQLDRMAMLKAAAGGQPADALEGDAVIAKNCASCHTAGKNPKGGLALFDARAVLTVNLQQIPDCVERIMLDRDYPEQNIYRMPKGVNLADAEKVRLTQAFLRRASAVARNQGAPPPGDKAPQQPPPMPPAQ